MFNAFVLMNPDILRRKINQALQEKNMTISQVEKISGLGPTGLRHFLSGRTNNPKLKTIRLVSKALNMEFSEITNEEVEENFSALLESSWNNKMFFEVCSKLNKLIETNKPDISNREAFSIIKNLYYFCYENKDEDIERSFNEALFQEIIRIKSK